MAQTEAELKQLLKDAKEQIERLTQDNAGFAAAFQQLQEGQKAEVEQILQLTEQIWALEEALAAAHSDRTEVLEQLSRLKSKLDKLRRQATVTLDAAAASASRLELAARVYELAQAAEDDELARKTAAYNARLAAPKR